LLFLYLLQNVLATAESSVWISVHHAAVLCQKNVSWDHEILIVSYARSPTNLTDTLSDNKGSFSLKQSQADISERMNGVEEYRWAVHCAIRIYMPRRVVAA